MVQRAQAGRVQLAAIAGPPGIGKTTLINHLIDTTPTWHHLIVELDPTDTGVPGAAVKRVLMKLAGRTVEPAPTAEELVHDVLTAAQNAEEPTNLIIEDVQWMDQLSGEVLWRAARALESGKAMITLSYRTHTGTTSGRIERFLASGRRGHLIFLQPLTLQATQELLERKLKVPVSVRTARTILKATGGVPLLLSTVANWLASAPPHQRQLSTALKALENQRDGNQRIFTHALLATLKTLSPAEQFTVHLLAVAETALRVAVLQMILMGEGLEPVNIAQLLDTGLVASRHGTSDMTIAHSQLASLIAQQMPLDRRLHLHTLLAANTTGETALYQRVQAKLLTPHPERVEALVTELTDAATEALNQGHVEAAFRRFRWALWFSDDPELLGLAVRTALESSPAKLLPALRSHLDRAPVTRVVSAASACLRLIDGDLTGALGALQQGLGLPESPGNDMGTILPCQALALIGRSAHASGELHLVGPTIDMALPQLRRVLESAGADGNPGKLAELTGLEAQLRMYSALRDPHPVAKHRAVSELEQLLDALENTPGVERSRDSVAVVLGTIMRRQGRVPEAYQLLYDAFQRRNVDDAFQVHLATQLGIIAFQSGYWDEAQQLFTAAIEDSLLLPETVGVLAAHAWAALVPLGRGESSGGHALLDLVTTRSCKQDTIVNIGVWFARGVEALMAEDHPEVVRWFGEIDGVQSGWSHVGHCWQAMYARSLIFMDRAHVVPRLQRRVELEAVAIPAPLLEAINQTLGATLKWAGGDLVGAHDGLRRTIELLDSLPPVRPGAVDNLGGSHALLRAFAISDVAELAINHRELAQQRPAIARLTQQAAAVFLRCGATTMHQKCSTLFTTLVNSDEFDEFSLPGDPQDGEPEDESIHHMRRDQAYKRLSTLTSRERQIALDVAQGRSNKEIATALFLSVRTVEYHVANCLTKLDLRSRVDLRNVLSPALEVRMRSDADA